MGTRQKFEKLINGALASHRRAVVRNMKQKLALPVPPGSEVLWFSIDSDVYGIPCGVRTRDARALKEIGEDYFWRLLPDFDDEYVPRETIEEYEDEIQESASALAARLIAQFVRDCFVAAGGPKHACRAYATDNGGEALNLKTGEWVRIKDIHNGTEDQDSAPPRSNGKKANHARGMTEPPPSPHPLEPQAPFIRAILSDPLSDLPFEGYADWLEEQGDPDRAESIRCGIQIDRHARQGLIRPTVDQRDAWDRCEAIDKEHSPRWKKSLPKIKGIAFDSANGPFTGGLCESVYIDNVESFCKHADQILDIQPVHHFVYRWNPSDDVLRTLLGVPALARLGRLSMCGGQDEGVARVLPECPHLARLQSLSLAYNDMSDDGPRGLARAPHLQSLRELLLQKNSITAVGVKALAAAQHFKGLEALNLSQNPLGVQGAQALAAGVKMPRLRALHLRSTQIGTDGVRALVEGKRLKGLQWLELDWCELDAGAVRLLADSGQLTAVEALSISQNPQLKDIAPLVAVRFNALESLDLYGCGLNASAAEILGRARWAKQLKRLALGGNALGDAGFRSLLKVDFTGLENLSLSSPRGSDAGLAEFLREARLPKLQSLDLHMPDKMLGLAEDDILRLADRERFPALEHLALGRADVSLKTDGLLRKRFRRLQLVKPKKTKA